jgi:hypothetical protein
MLRRKFGPMVDEVMGSWIKLKNGQLHNFTLNELLLG